MNSRVILFMPVVFMLGCSYFRNRVEPEMLDSGLTLVLPGIEGQSFFNSNIAQGLIDSDVETAVEVHDWTTGWMINFLYHLQAYGRNLKQADILAQKIIDYQDKFPGRPVNLVGHSGGCGIILMALNALPEDRKVSHVILLAPAVSRRFDLSTALSRTENGIWNFHSYGDTVLLILGTTMAGSMDRKFGASAGSIGFIAPKDSSESQEQEYRDKLHQVHYHLGMLKTGYVGGHFGLTNRRFVRKYLSPLLRPESN